MKRNVGLDSLRIVAMIMIVILHVNGKGGFVASDSNFAFYRVMLLVETICIVAVNCYVLITGYFQSESKFKIKKIVNIWIKTVFYSISIYIILLIFGKDFNLKDAIKSFFPILINEYWFVNCYLVLYILSPFINILIQHLGKKQYQKLLFILLVVFCVLPSILPANYTLDNAGGYGIIWFIILYLVGAYIRLYLKFNYKNIRNLISYFLISIVSYLLILIVQYICDLLQISDLSGKVYGYNFITVFLASVFLFLYFKNIEIKNSRVIKIVSKIAPLTFGVYIIHEQIVLRSILYLDILKLNQLWNKSIQFLIIPIIAIIIFLVCILIERVTNNTIQKWIYNVLEKIYLKIKSTKYYEKLECKILQK